MPPSVLIAAGSPHGVVVVILYRDTFVGSAGLDVIFGVLDSLESSSTAATAKDSAARGAGAMTERRVGERKSQPRVGRSASGQPMALQICKNHNNKEVRGMQ